MWSPTHVLVTVHRARGLLTKGKHGTNDAFVTISLGKEKYQTSVKEKAAKDVDWHEECELPIPKQGNTAEIILTALHRNFLGVDEFLGAAHIPLADFDVYERPKCKWYELKGKPGKEKNKQRGDLEVKVTFKVKAGSLTDLSKKERSKSSLGQLSHMAHSVGGSLLSIGSLEKRKGLKNIARTIGNKMGKHRKDKDKDELQGPSDTVLPNSRRVGQIAGDADPGVISEDEDEFTFDDLSHKSSQGSLSALHTNTTPVVGSLENLAGGEFLRRTSVAVAPPKPARVPPPEKAVDEWEQKLYGKQGKDSVVNNMDTLKRRSWDSPKTLLSSQPEEEEPTENNLSGTNQVLRTETPVQPTAAPRRNTEDLSKSVSRVTEKSEEKEKEKEMSKLARKFKQFRKGDKHQDIISDRPHVDERIIIGGEDENLGSIVNLATSKIPSQFLQKYDCNAKEELIAVIYNMQKVIDNQTKKMKDLEDYLDNLLLRVMETTPRILQNPYVSAHFDGSSRRY